MSNSFFDTQFTTVDGISIDGQPHRFIGHSARGYLFASTGAGQIDALTEIDAADLVPLMIQPGRLIVQPEHFKSRKRK